MPLSSFVSRRKKQWQHFRHLPAGQRFEIHHREQQKSQKSKWAHVLGLILIPVFLAIGVVLMFIPGPAILFFFLAAGLLSAHSLWVARTLDRAELSLRAGVRKLRRFWSHSSALKKAALVLAVGLVVLGAGLGALALFMMR